MVVKEEVSHPARVCFLGQSAGLGPLLMLLSVPEGQAERTLIFLADASLGWGLVTGCGLPESPPNLSPLKK